LSPTFTFVPVYHNRISVVKMVDATARMGLTLLVTLVSGPDFADGNITEPSRFKKKLECGPMPNVRMVALPNIGGAVCSTPQFG